MSDIPNRSANVVPAATQVAPRLKKALLHFYGEDTVIPFLEALPTVDMIDRLGKLLEETHTASKNEDGTIDYYLQAAMVAKVMRENQK